MKREIIFTLQNSDFSKDICVSIDILVKELRPILKEKYKLDNDFKLFSENHQKILSEDSSLYEEMIWDGDILKVMR